jgi:hypothetical protein
MQCGEVKEKAGWRRNSKKGRVEDGITYVLGLGSRDGCMNPRHDRAVEERIVGRGASVLDLAARGATNRHAAGRWNG